MQRESITDVFGPKLPFPFISPHPKQNIQEITLPVTQRISQNSINSAQLSRPSISPSVHSNQQQAERSSLSAISFLAMETSSRQNIQTDATRKLLRQNTIDRNKKYKKNRKTKIEKKLNKFIDSIGFNLCTLFLTIFALFGSDFEILLSDSSSSLGFDIGRIITMFIFLFEILASSFAKKKYLGSFFFILDLLSTLTMLLDLSWIKNELALDQNTSATARLARASRATRMGTRIGRIIRILRLIRFFKLYKAAINTKKQKDRLKSFARSKSNHFNKKPSLSRSDSKAFKEKKWYKPPDRNPIIGNKGKNRKSQQVISLFAPNENRISVSIDVTKRQLNQEVEKMQIQSFSSDKDLLNQIEEEINLKESKVGKKLSRLTTTRVTIIVLILLLLVPLADSSYWDDPPLCSDLAARQISSLSELKNKSTTENISKLCQEIIENCKISKYPILYISSYNDVCSYGKPPDDSFRSDEFLASYDQYESFWAYVVSDYRYNTRMNSLLNMMRTLFVSLLLTIASIYFTRDVDELILNPVERMMNRVHKLAEDPLNIKNQQFNLDGDVSQKELLLIEHSIIKISTILALGFGEAGAEILSSSVKTNYEADFTLTRGKKKYAVFGFCDIRNFTDVTEVLQEDVMLFVNNVAGIVHSLVDRFNGAANKNVGDAFLLVWRFSELQNMFMADEYDQEFPESNQKIIRIADLALLSFLKIIAKLNKSPKLYQYREHPKLRERIKNYKVKLGFGIHIGWAIEGAIGSSYKIDISYIGHHVNVSSTLEACTKAYGVQILISEYFYKFLSEKMKVLCRLVDNIVLKGSNKPFKIYTLDLHTDDMPLEKDKSHLDKGQMQAFHALKKKMLIEALDNDCISIEEFLDNGKDFKYLLKRFNVYFLSTFHAGMQEYINGDWESALKLFQTALLEKVDDGPCNVLINYMRQFNFKKPDFWQGYRELKER